MLTATKTQTDDLLRALRNWHPSHNEMVDFFAGLASAVKSNHHALSLRCSALVIDYCDEATGQIELDLIDQQAEQTWADRARSPLGQRFPELAQIDALTVRRSA